MIRKEVQRIKFSPSISWLKIVTDQKPVVIENLASNWPAISDPDRKWSDIPKLMERIDINRKVSIEVGKNYMDPHIKKVDVFLRDYLEFISKPKEALKDVPNVYLAQYELHEIPEMDKDVICPGITQVGKGHLYRTNIWFGSPLGTISPCHFDPFNNMVVQVIGKKKIDIIHPHFTPNVYPAYGTLQRNTSMVDFEKPDLEEFPLFSQAEGIEAELNPGDGLFIPFKWWHYCKTTSLSCSVNFWWL